ncbi:MAG: multidrug effflux MFS transporter [Pseudomonadota bacterium]
MADNATPQKTGDVATHPESLNMGTGEFVVLIASLMALNALAIDVMLPALDEIAAALGVASANDQQLVIYAYIAGFGVPQLVWGPLTDRYGRRSIVFFALIGYGVTGLACMFAPSFSLLLAMRFSQGIFASACRVVAVSIVRDIFAGRGMAKVMSLIMTIFMIVPILAPYIGQLILFVAPWEWTFGSLVIAALIVMVWAWVRLPETLPEHRRRPLNPSQTLGDYWSIFKDPVTFGYMLASGVIFGALFAFIGSSEQVMTEVFGLGDSFVLWFAAVAGVLSLSNFANSRLVERYGMRRMSQLALIAFTGLGLILLALTALLGPRFAVFFPLFAMMFGCFGMIGSNFSAMAMESQGSVAGTASAAYGFFTTTLSSFIGWLIGRQYDGTVIPIIAGFVALGMICMVLVALVEKGKFFQSR